MYCDKRYTLDSQINGVRRLFIIWKYSSLDTVIRGRPFIYLLTNIPRRTFIRCRPFIMRLERTSWTLCSRFCIQILNVPKRYNVLVFNISPSHVFVFIFLSFSFNAGFVRTWKNLENGCFSKKLRETQGKFWKIMPPQGKLQGNFSALHQQKNLHKVWSCANVSLSKSVCMVCLDMLILAFVIYNTKKNQNY